MKAKSQLNMSLFDEAEELALGGLSELLILNKSQLVHAIAEIQAADSILRVRKGVHELKSRLLSASDAELFDVAALAEEETAELGRDSLFEELKQIAEALTLERAKYYLERLEKGISAPKTGKINDINLNRWKEYRGILTDSLWVMEKRDSSGVHSAGYWGNFIPQIPNQMMRRYTKKGEWVLDTFAGSGTTLIESQRLARNAIGIELQPHIAEKARALIEAEPNSAGIVNEVINADSATVNYSAILKKHGQKKVQLVIMHPPYFDIIKFSDSPLDLSNAPSLASFLAMIGKVASNALSVLEKNRYLVLVIGDKYARGEWIPLGFAAMNEIQQLGCTLKSIIVKNFEDTTGKRAQKELWRYRALVGGFYIFKHEYIFLFQKK